jgi:hypothetical protein
MKFRYRLAAAGFLALLTVTSCSSGSGDSTASPSVAAPAAFQDHNADGASLANAWFELLSQTGSAPGTLGATEEQAREGSALVRPYLDSAFQNQRASGEHFTADNYLPSDIDDFEISDVVVTAPRDDIRIVRYAIRTPGAADLGSGMAMSADFAPRLTVFRWDADLGHWVIVSHANFNQSVAAICDQTPIPTVGAQPSTGPEDVALGESIVEQWREITTGKTSANVRHPESQIQLANGQGWPSANGAPIKWTPATDYTYADLSVTRNADLLVLSFDAVESGLEMEGVKYRSIVAPRLLTYLRNNDGKWEMISLANFTVPTAVPENVDCLKGSS